MMPLIVDRDRRRRTIAALATKIIAEDGPDAITVRRVAAAAGYSTKIVSHYFTSKDELLCFVFREAASDAVRRVRSLQRNEDLQHCLQLLLPINRKNRLTWRMWIAFWGRAASNDAFAREQIATAAATRRLIKDLLESDRHRRRLPADFDSEAASQRLLATIIGLAVQAVLDPTAWTPSKQRRVLAAEIMSMLPRT
jgi:AcrR family transcriptional regulator